MLRAAVHGPGGRVAHDPVAQGLAHPLGEHVRLRLGPGAVPVAAHAPSSRSRSARTAGSASGLRYVVAPQRRSHILMRSAAGVLSTSHRPSMALRSVAASCPFRSASSPGVSKSCSGVMPAGATTPGVALPVSTVLLYAEVCAAGMSSRSCVKMSDAAVTLSTAATRLRLFAILSTVLYWSALSGLSTRPSIWPVMAGSSAPNSTPRPPTLA